MYNSSPYPPQPAPQGGFPTWLIVVIVIAVLCLLCCCIAGVGYVFLWPSFSNEFSSLLPLALVS